VQGKERENLALDLFFKGFGKKKKYARKPAREKRKKTGTVQGPFKKAKERGPSVHLQGKKRYSMWAKALTQKGGKGGKIAYRLVYTGGGNGTGIMFFCRGWKKKKRKKKRHAYGTLVAGGGGGGGGVKFP